MAKNNAVKYQDSSGKFTKAPQERVYVCNKWRSLKVGNVGDMKLPHAQFENGYFKTSDPDVQKLIEGLASFGTHVRWQDNYGTAPVRVDPEASATKDLMERPAETTGGSARQGMVHSLNV